jgi:hypothetical protein
MAALHVLRRLQGARRRGGRETPTSGTVHLGDALTILSSEERKQPQKKINALLSVFFYFLTLPNSCSAGRCITCRPTKTSFFAKSPNPTFPLLQGERRQCRVRPSQAEGRRSGHSTEPSFILNFPPTKFCSESYDCEYPIKGNRLYCRQ